MGSVIGDILPLAIGVAISPVPIIAVILMLFTKQAKPDSVAFLGGWILGLAIVGSIVLIVASIMEFDPNSGESTASAAIRLVLGLLFLAIAVKQWKGRPKPGAEPKTPKWMAAIESFTPVKALGLAALLSGVNPKNLALTLAAAVTIAQAELGTGQAIVSLVIFIIIASISVAAPVLIYLTMGEKASKTLDGWKTWLIANNATVMFVLLLILGVLLVGKGISGLTS
jgi:hypothetical protein